jgi:hypothetical protein
MTIMKRREYLALMSATGLAMATSCVQREQPATSNQPATSEAAKQASIVSSEKPKKWTNDWDKPFPERNPNQIVKLVFYGLSGFEPIEKGSKHWCEIGFFSKAYNGHIHDLSIYAYTEVGGSSTRVYDSRKPKEQIALIEFKVEKPDSEFNEVYFFQPGEVENRSDLRHRNDFRWIIDLESDYAYGSLLGSDKLDRDKSFYTPNFNVESGLFYTMRRTASIFEIKSDDQTRKSTLGRVADVVGANIYVEPETDVILTINGNDANPYRVKAPGEIYFVNTCTKNSNRCKFPYPKGSKKEERNDFYLHYKAIDLKGKPELGLYQIERPDYEKIDVKCSHDIPASKLTDRQHFEEAMSSDESPCSASGFGNS